MTNQWIYGYIHMHYFQTNPSPAEKMKYSNKLNKPPSFPQPTCKTEAVQNAFLSRTSLFYGVEVMIVILKGWTSIKIQLKNGFFFFFFFFFRGVCCISIGLMGIHGIHQNCQLNREWWSTLGLLWSPELRKRRYETYTLYIYRWGFPKMEVPNSWMVYIGKSDSHEWFRGTRSSGNLQINFPEKPCSVCKAGWIMSLIWACWIVIQTSSSPKR